MPTSQRVRYQPRIWLAIAAAILAAIFMLSPAQTRQLLANSAILAGGATAIALPLGILLAVLLVKVDLAGRRIAVAGLGVLLFLPLYVQLSGWDAALGKLGWLTLTFGTPASAWLDGMRAAIFVHGMAAVPWVALIVGLGLVQVDGRQEEAALLEASPLMVLLRVTLPQCVSFILAAGVWVVVMTAAEMTVTNIYLIDSGDRTYTEELYMSFALGADPGEATLSVLPGLASLALLIGTMLALTSEISGRRVLAKISRPLALPAGAYRWPLTWLLWSGVLLLLAPPMASLIVKAGFVVAETEGERIRSWSAAKCVQEVLHAPAAFREEFGWTAILALLAATLATVAAIGLAWLARRGGWRAVPAMLTVVLGLVVPGPLVGLLLIAALNHPWPPLAYLYNQTALAPVLAQAVRALPLTIMLCWHCFATLGDDVLAAAQLDGAGPWQTLWRIALPQRRLAIAGAWLAALAVAAGDLAWSQLVMPPGLDTIQRRVFGLVHSGVEEQVAAICLVVTLAYALLAGLILAFVRRAK